MMSAHGGSQEQIVAKNVVCTVGCTADNISRHDMLNWLNTTLEASLGKIEEMKTGAAYCQLMHKLWPKCISLKKVKFQTQLEHEMRQNFMVFQTALNKVGIDKQIPIDKLIQGKFQDNFGFLQWFKKFYDANIKETEYSAMQARGNIQLGSGKVPFQVKKKVEVPAMTLTTPELPVTSTPSKIDPDSGHQSHLELSKISEGEQKSLTKETNTLAEFFAGLNEEKKQLLEGMQVVKQEKTFYFKKISLIESICTNYEDNPFAVKVVGILHGTNEENN